jgi:hypothetical protein
MEYRYDIKQFNWNKDTNTFGADAWDLVAYMPDGSMYPDPFPNRKKDFIIQNPKTGGFRRFRFVKEHHLSFGIDEYTQLNWLFESEDGIKCYICVEP